MGGGIHDGTEHWMTFNFYDNYVRRLTEVATMPEQDIQPRPEVMAFARLMEERLRANDHKSGWRGIDPMSLLQMLDTERYELSFALGLGTREDIRHEAADIANFAMMIADVAGALVVERSDDDG